jgi:multiple sugar transport system substrate-binding protein
VFNKKDPQEVLASWLFTQYLLTNDMQISYAQTEGYVPVTLKAQQSPEYRDYLSRAGEDNELYYQIKMDATNLLLEHIDDTFVTPVFNGSASLRDAAGALVENVTKSVRRKQTVDEAYMEKLQSDILSLYRLDQSSSINGGRQELGELPAASVILLSSLGGVWCLILLYLLKEYIKKSGK